MYYSDRVILVRRAGRKTEEGKPVLDDIGNQVFEETRTEVWADVLSPTRAETTSAGAKGLTPSYTIKVHADDYDGQTVVEIGTRRMAVYRTYRPGPDEVELYVAEKRGDINADH